MSKDKEYTQISGESFLEVEEGSTIMLKIKGTNDKVVLSIEDDLMYISVPGSDDWYEVQIESGQIILK